jgi:hypothetical protein
MRGLILFMAVTLGACAAPQSGAPTNTGVSVLTPPSIGTPAPGAPDVVRANEALLRSAPSPGQPPNTSPQNNPRALTGRELQSMDSQVPLPPGPTNYNPYGIDAEEEYPAIPDRPSRIFRQF